VFAWLLAPSARTGERASRTESTRVPESERTPQAGERPRRGSRRPDPLPASRCPAGLARCRAAQGRILFVEAVDPDGDGDLHVVIAGGGVSAPGITAVDVAPALRPRRDPRVGDRASAAGQVQRGSFGQSQIHAVEFHVRRSSAEH
jgi:hypothetical protein